MKPSWEDIAVFAFLLFFALIMANGWPFKIQVSVNLLNWVQTAAAFIAAVGGIYTAYIALSVARQEREERKQSALKYLLAEMSTFANFQNVAERVLNIEFGGLTEEGLLEIKELLSSLRGLSRERIIEASTALGELLLITENRINALLQSKSPTNNSTFKYIYSPGIAKEIKANTKAMSKAVNKLFYRNENWEFFLDIRNHE